MKGVFFVMKSLSYLGMSIYINESIKNPANKEFRQHFGLPITKKIVCYDVSNRSRDPLLVHEVIVAKEYIDSAKLLVSLEDGNDIFILSDFLVEMQKPTFVSTYFSI